MRVVLLCILLSFVLFGCGIDDERKENRYCVLVEGKGVHIRDWGASYEQQGNKVILYTSTHKVKTTITIADGCTVAIYDNFPE